jgi:para-nitrobenzyl esterase
MNRRLASYLIGLLLAPALMGGSSEASAQSTTVVVNTTNGPVRGTWTSSQRRFLGVRYAASTAGAKRWTPPVAPAHWNTPADATQFGSGCPQPPSPFGIPSTNEDCLFLNVFTPVPAVLPRRPVMVWFHGGALYLGQSTGYDPTKLVDQGTIVVTVNYRLGALGFMAHPELTAQSSDHASGNYGLMDQQLALKWIQQNIANFGGDPDNVTIFGQSAGGLSVLSHMVSPGSAGLFDRAIVQSGAITLDTPPLAVAEAQGTDLANRAACENLACVRALPVADLLAVQLPPGAIGYFPDIDGKVLTQSYRTAFTSGNFNRVPVISGTTHDEWRLFVGLGELQAGGPLPPEAYGPAIVGTLGPQVVPALPAIMAQYPLSNYGGNASLALSAVGTDAIFGCNGLTAAQLISQYVPVWTYEFNDPNAINYIIPPVSFPYGAYHAGEIQYVLGVTPNFPVPPMTANQQALAEDMVIYWSQFARIGNPNGIGAPLWLRSNQTDWLQSLVVPTPVRSSGNAFAIEHKCGFWAALAGGGG